MNEDRRHSGAELSDAELADVSGARGDEFYAKASKICIGCGVSGGHCGGVRIASLAAYLRDNGANSVSTYQTCPFYRH